ncbi:MAG: hypothetical protein HY696_10785 [Deltaproteobacteria bacterium]|nr:hypothetical protein [Deltaproteobacteria bacterium]
MMGVRRRIPFLGLTGFGAVSARRRFGFIMSTPDGAPRAGFSPTLIEELPVPFGDIADAVSCAAEMVAYQRMVSRWLGRNHAPLRPRMRFGDAPGARGGSPRMASEIAGRLLRRMGAPDRAPSAARGTTPSLTPPERLQQLVAEVVSEAAHPRSWVEALMHGVMLTSSQQAAAMAALHAIALRASRLSRPPRQDSPSAGRKRQVFTDFDAMIRFWTVAPSLVEPYKALPAGTQWLIAACFGYPDLWRDLGSQLTAEGDQAGAGVVVLRTFERLREDLWRRLQNRIGHDRKSREERHWAHDQPIDLEALRGLNGRGPQGVWLAKSAQPPASVAPAAPRATETPRPDVAVQTLLAEVEHADAAAARMVRGVVIYLKRRGSVTEEQAAAVRCLLQWATDAAHRADVQQVLKVRGEAALLHLFAYADLPALQRVAVLQTMSRWAQESGHQSITFHFERRGPDVVVTAHRPVMGDITTRVAADGMSASTAPR